jgi:hypothetical protein
MNRAGGAFAKSGLGKVVRRHAEGSEEKPEEPDSD